MIKYRINVVVKKPKENNKTYAQGALVAQVLINNKYHKGSEFLLHRMSLEEAIKRASNWCLEMSKKYSIEVEPLCVHDIKARLSKPIGERLTPEEKPHVKLSSLLLDALSHPTRRKAVIKHAISIVGIAKLAAILDDTNQEFDAVSSEQIEIANAEKSANKAIAESMFKVQKETGIDMISKIADPSVLLLFKELVAESKNRSSYRPTQDFGKYILNGEIWNEQLDKHPPTSFKKWLHTNNKFDYEELRLGAKEYV